MATELRKTGISVVGDMPWGTHFCFFYGTKGDLLDILVRYFKVGLENDEFCLWIISKSELLTAQEATNALRKALPDLDRYIAQGAIEVVDHYEWFLNGSPFDPHRVVNRFKQKADEALARGYAGMRINGSPAWMQKEDGEGLLEFEKELERLFPNERIIASCTYPLAESGAAELLDVTRTHQFAIVRRQGNWELIETPELKHAKAEIERLNKGLEQRVDERTRELAAANEELKREIFERKRVEEEFQNSQEQLRNLAAYLQSVREKERTHIARELHDEIGQSVTAIKLALEQRIRDPSVGDPARLAQALALANELIGRARDLSLELRPAMLDDLGLQAALRWHFDRYTTQFKIAVDFKQSGLEGRRFAPEIETAAYRIVQETLTNVARHAKTDKVAVEIHADEDLLRVRIKDEGIGFDPHSLPAERSGGLTGMRERAIMLGGQLWLESAAGLGTLLRTEIPLQKDVQTDDG